MITRDIFLASSITELHSQRMELGNFIRAMVDRIIGSGLYIRLHMCEDISDEIVLSRKQDTYNQAIRSCDYFYVMFGSKVGSYTEEELETALEQYGKTGKPKPFICFLELPGEPPEAVRKLMEKLDSRQLPYRIYRSIDEVKLSMLLELEKDLRPRLQVEFRGGQVLVNGQMMGICPDVMGEN